MHELSIAMSMIEMASEEAVRNDQARVVALHLKLGPLAGVVKEALLFSYEIACQGTLLEGSQLIIEDVPVVVHCSSCDHDLTVASIQNLRCPSCSSSSVEVVQGRELEVVALELEQAEVLVS
ncbi:MAG TPA: hydrogenase maturation nickel metallochaperone HypA [Pyrinomonadaceae bacterium]